MASAPNSRAGCQAIDYMLKRWEGFARFSATVGFAWPTARRYVGSALGRKSWLFAGSERGADRRPAAMYALIGTAKHQ